MHEIIERRGIDAAADQLSAVMGDQIAFMRAAFGHVQRAGDVIAHLIHCRGEVRQAVEETGLAVGVDIEIAEMGVAMDQRGRQGFCEFVIAMDGAFHPFQIVKAHRSRRPARAVDIALPDIGDQYGREIGSISDLAGPIEIPASTDLRAFPTQSMVPRDHCQPLNHLIGPLRLLRVQEFHAARDQIFHDDNTLLLRLAVFGEIAGWKAQGRMRSDIGIAVHFLVMHGMHHPAVRFEPAFQDHQFRNARRLARLIQIEPDADLGAGAMIDIDHFGIAQNDTRIPAVQRCIQPIGGQPIERDRERKRIVACHGGDPASRVGAMQADPNRLEKIMTSVDHELGTKNLKLEREGPILWCTIDRPHARNALTPSMYFGIKKAVQFVNADKELRAMIITGTGDVFAPGGDLGGRYDEGDQPVPDGLSYECLPFITIRESQAPIIAAVNGICQAGGLLISMLSDVAVVSERATFRVPELLRGIIDATYAAILPMHIGMAQARDLLLTARKIDAAEAHRIGLISRLVKHEDLRDEARKAAWEILQTAPDCRAHVKRMLNHQYATIDYETMFASLRNPNSEAGEGMRAFMEKRQPNWIPEGGPDMGR